MVNFVCIVSKQGVKMLTLSSMENLHVIVECNLNVLLMDFRQCNWIELHSLDCCGNYYLPLLEQHVIVLKILEENKQCHFMS